MRNHISLPFKMVKIFTTMTFVFLILTSCAHRKNKIRNDLQYKVNIDESLQHTYENWDTGFNR